MTCATRPRQHSNTRLLGQLSFLSGTAQEMTSPPSSLSLALAPSFAAVCLLRGVDGLGKGGKDGPKDALVALDAGELRAGRAFGVLRALDTAGSVAGPAIAGLPSTACTSQRVKVW